MVTYLKILLFTNPLHGLRFLDTFPWLLLFTPKSLSIRYSAIPLIALCCVLLVLSIFIIDDISSSIKLFVFLIFTIFFIFSKRQRLSIGPKYLFVILCLLVIEDLLIKYVGFLSPFVRDPFGAMFLFREKSYAALFIGFMLSYFPTSDRSWLPIILLLGIFLSLQSSLGWAIFSIFMYHRFYKNIKFMPSTGSVTFLAIFLGYMYFYFLGNAGIGFLFSASDALRFLINLESLSVVHYGSFYLHNAAEYSPIILDIGEGYMADWLNLAPQAPFFLIAYYFGSFGILIAVLFFIAYMWALTKHSTSSVSFIHAMIIINFLLQGFLLSPYLFGYLFIHAYEDNSNDPDRI